jgi:hypothetical protein
MIGNSFLSVDVVFSSFFLSSLLCLTDEDGGGGGGGGRDFLFKFASSL